MKNDDFNPIWENPKNNFENYKTADPNPDVIHSKGDNVSKQTGLDVETVKLGTGASQKIARNSLSREGQKKKTKKEFKDKRIAKDIIKLAIIILMIVVTLIVGKIISNEIKENNIVDRAEAEIHSLIDDTYHSNIDTSQLAYSNGDLTGYKTTYWYDIPALADIVDNDLSKLDMGIYHAYTHVCEKGKFGDSDIRGIMNDLITELRKTHGEEVVPYETFEAHVRSLGYGGEGKDLYDNYKKEMKKRFKQQALAEAARESEDVSRGQ